MDIGKLSIQKENILDTIAAIKQSMSIWNEISISSTFHITYDIYTIFLFGPDLVLL